MLFYILMLVILPPLAIDEFAPSMPAMVYSFGTTISKIQLCISFYLLSQGVSQVISAPFSDYYGRKKLLINTLSIYLLGTLLCMLTTNISFLLIGRFIQGIGMGCCAITAPALISDIYKGEKFTKISAQVVTVYSLVPITAPFIGGYIQEWVGWRGNFGLLFLLPFAVLITTIFYVPETRIVVHTLTIKQLIRNYKMFIFNRIYMGCLGTIIFLWSIIVIFSVSAPFILQNQLSYSASQYGHVALLVGLAFFLGNLISRSLPDDRTVIGIKIGLSIQLLISVIMFVFACTSTINIWQVILPIIMISTCNGIVLPKLYAQALSLFPELTGIASSLLGVTMLLGSVLITCIIAYYKIHSMVGVSCIYSMLALGSFAIYIFVLKKYQINYKGQFFKNVRSVD
jgi:MFS transporter, DHA1 family, multidrug resistance protein